MTDLQINRLATESMNIEKPPLIKSARLALDKRVSSRSDLRTKTTHAKGIKRNSKVDHKYFN